VPAAEYYSSIEVSGTEDKSAFVKGIPAIAGKYQRLAWTGIR
jgi:hypothetical protein